MDHRFYAWWLVAVALKGSPERYRAMGRMCALAGIVLRELADRSRSPLPGRLAAMLEERFTGDAP